MTNWATDYRYPAASGAPNPVVEPYPIHAGLGERCVRLQPRSGSSSVASTCASRPMVKPSASRWNPSPAFSYYEQAAGVPIAAALRRRLAAA